MNRAPKNSLRPTPVGRETFLIHDHQGEGTGPVVVALNSLVIRGRQPVVVDTGAAENRDQFLEDVFSLVEPADIRWVFISHDDVDHTGAVNELMASCPNATLVINWFMVERMGESLEVPPDRWRSHCKGSPSDIRPPQLRCCATSGWTFRLASWSRSRDLLAQAKARWPGHCWACTL